MRVALLALLALLAAVSVASGSAVDSVAALSSSSRILYSSDWSGSGEIYAIDPARAGSTRQLTFGRAPACLAAPGTRCGYGTPAVSPDGRWIAFGDYSIQGSTPAGIFIARADGRDQRRVAGLSRPSDWLSVPAVWAPDSRRLAYAGQDGIHVIDRSGTHDERVHAGTADDSPAWSWDGSRLAFVDSATTGGSQTLSIAQGHAVRAVARSGRYDGFIYAWSPSDDVIAYTDRRGLFVVRPTASGGRHLAARVTDFAWSPNGRLLAFTNGGGLRVFDVATRATHRLGREDGSGLNWLPDGRRLAFVGRDGVRVVDIATGAVRAVDTQASSSGRWSPNGRALAYLVGTGALTDWTSSDLVITNLSGVTRTVIRGSGRYGGSIGEPVWTRPPAGLRYRRPAPRSVAVVSPDALIAPWPIERLASEGDRVAYVACGHIFVWTPSSRNVVQTEPSATLAPACQSERYYTSYKVYDLALAADRVGFGSVCCSNGRAWWLGGTGGPVRKTFTLGRGYATNGGPYKPAGGELVGELAGSGDLLVFAAWTEDYGPNRLSIVTTRQEIRRAVVGGCPCPTIASSPGPLVPFDVDRGRIVAGGDNETWVLDGNGTRLLTVEASPAAAQLSGSDLVVLRRGELRDYDSGTGAHLHTWPLPDVPSGAECETPNSIRCSQPRLALEDAARGLVTYVLDGQVHVLRLADGADVIVASGATARFIDSGLVYANSLRLRLIPFDRLPLP